MDGKKSPLPSTSRNQSDNDKEQVNPSPLIPSVSAIANSSSSSSANAFPQYSSYKSFNVSSDEESSVGAEENVIYLSSDDSVELIEYKSKSKKKRRHEKKSKGDRKMKDMEERSKSNKNSSKDNEKNASNSEQSSNIHIDRSGDSNNLTCDKITDYQVPKYSRKDVINLADDKKEIPKRYYSSHKLTDPENKTEENYFIYPTGRYKAYSQILNYDSIQLINENISTEELYSSNKVLKSDSKSPYIGPQSYSSFEHPLSLLGQMFNKDLLEDKTNVEKWIDFIHYQDVLYESECKTDKNFQMQKKFWIERKVDICNKALVYNAKSFKLNLLKLKLLSTYSAELEKESTELDEEWKNLCFRFPNEPQCWFEWIYFSIRSGKLAHFKAINRTQKIFKEAFISLSRKHLEGQFQSHQIESSDIELVLINLTLFYAEFLSSIDQTEKAIGLFQALIEFNLYTPDEIDFNVSFEDWYALFEQFWDSGVSRIGEFVSIEQAGWKNFQSQLNKGEESVKVKDNRNFTIFGTKQAFEQFENEIINQISNSLPDDKKGFVKSLSWVHFERMKHYLHWLPVSAQLPTNNSMDDIEDPERIVLSNEDIKPFLYRLRKHESKFYLAKKFLQFLQVPLTTYTFNSAYTSSFFEIEFDFDPNLSECSLGPSQKLFEISKKFQSRLFNLSESYVFDLFKLKGEFEDDYSVTIPLQNIFNNYDKIFIKTNQAFIDNVFEKLFHLFRDNEQNIMSLQMMWIQHKIELFHRNIISATDMKKFFKEIARTNESIDLYSVYFCFWFQVDVCETLNIYFNTIKALMESEPNNMIKMLRLTLSFARRLTNMDFVMLQFIHTANFSYIELDPKFRHPNIFINIKAIALNALISVINKNDSSEFCLEKLNVSANARALDKAVATLQQLLANNEKKYYEWIQAQAFIYFIDNDIKKLKDFFEEKLSPDYLPHIYFEAPFKVDQKSLERSLFLLSIQIVLYEYIRIRNVFGAYAKTFLSYLGELVNRALESFPFDPVFLALAVVFETRFTILSKTRKFFKNYLSAERFRNYFIKRYINHVDCSIMDEMVSADSLYNIFMAALHLEFASTEKKSSCEKNYNFGITAHLIRNYFHQALNYNDKSMNQLMNLTLQDCPTIWRLFIRFEETEFKRRKKSESEAKKDTSILYRAMQTCPNHKPIYFDTILMEPDMLQECVDIMIDKQLRVRTLIEEMDLLINANESKTEQQKK